MLSRVVPLVILVCACGSPAATTAPDVDVRGPTVRFVALGDTGHGNDTEYAVARAMERTCEVHGGCALALMLGDNIYPRGVSSASDPQMQTKLDQPFAIDRFPFYGALGNHDYGPSWEFWRANAEIEAAARSSKLRMPARHYSFGAGPVGFFAIDTNALFWGATDEERAVLHDELARDRHPWKIAFGHHPYLSNGRHGNAGAYDRIPASWLPGAGGALRNFFEDEICGHVDVYLSGHDHTLQDLGEHCGTQFLVSGAGSETTLLGSRNPTLFQASIPGFLLVEASEEALDLTFVDLNGHELHHRHVQRR